MMTFVGFFTRARATLGTALLASAVFASACGSMNDVAFDDVDAATSALRGADDWLRVLRPAMTAVGFSPLTQNELAAQFARIDQGAAAAAEVSCIDDFIGPLGKVSKKACIAHLNLLGCTPGSGPLCEEDTCSCTSTD